MTFEEDFPSIKRAAEDCPCYNCDEYPVSSEETAPHAIDVEKVKEFCLDKSKVKEYINDAFKFASDAGEKNLCRKLAEELEVELEE